MQQLIYFLQKYKYFLFFLLLQIIALALTINNHSYHKSKFITSANAISGGMFEKSAQFSDYFNLNSQNEELSQENTRLKNRIEQLMNVIDDTKVTEVLDTTTFQQQYKYITAKVIRNDYHSSYNYLLLNKGTQHGVTKEMAVYNSKGLLGVTDHTSDNYARVKSILNMDSKINARLKNSYHFGTLTWNGKEYNTVQLTDIPRQAKVQVGDTIITGGKSTIFPEGIPIGTIAKVAQNHSSSNEIDIKLFNDMSNLGYTYIVINLHKKELQNLEN